ncbi:MAG: hypothetical protein ACRD22_02735 [Terriglobia bacterium]
MENPHTGSRLGPRLAMLISRAIVATHNQLLGTKHKLGMALFNSMSDQISSEVHHTIGPVLQALADSESLDANTKRHLTFFAQQHGQLTALAGAQMASSSILGSLAQVVNNAAAPAVRDLIALSPEQALDPNTLAQMVAHGINDVKDTQHDVAGQGFNAGQYDTLIELSRVYPAIADGLNMYRRGLISDNDLTVIFQRNGLPESQWDATKATAMLPLSPADAALAVLRGNMSQDAAVQNAHDWGINETDFEIIVGNTGEPLGLEQLLEAYRRGFIDQATLRKGILQSRVRDEWIPTAEKLRYSPMTVSDAVNAVVQNHMTMAEGEQIAQENGLQPGQFTTLYETAGEPLSRGEMYQLYNRGKVSETEVKQAERESRLKNKYNDVAFDLHERLLEPRMLSSAVQYGVISEQEAIKQATDYGYSADLAKVLIGEGAARKLQTYKARVVAAMESLYEDNAITEDDASRTIMSLGFTAPEAKFILEAADVRRTTKTVSQTISAIRGKYLARHITDKEAMSLLSALGVPTPQRDYLLANWAIEWQAYTKQLTEAQIIKAVKLQLIKPEDALQRLIYMGYSGDDAVLLIEGA